MIYVFEEVNSLDKKCYEVYHLSEDLLMEHAALGLKSHIPQKSKKILIVAGTGNNGADGIALARVISHHDCHLYIPFGVKSRMAKLQEKRAKSVGVKIVEAIEDDYDVVVDSLFGSGLNRALDLQSQALITRLNTLNAYKLACDIPSGLSIAAEAFRADKTVTMGARKELLYHDSAKDFVGEIVCVDLGVSTASYEEQSDTYLLEKKDMQLPYRQLQDTHKGSFGHLAVICGEKEGAAILAAQSASAFGVGLVTVVANVPHSFPAEIMSTTSLPTNTTAVCIGMGLGDTHDSTSLKDFLYHDMPLLVDADLFYHPLMKGILVRKNVVLTPHPKEFVSLLKMTSIADITVAALQKDRFHYVREFGKKFPDVVLLLKGANTLITQDKKLYILTFGTSALSKGGSGDVLGGLIASLLAQGYSPLDATITGALAHAFSAKKYSKNSYALLPFDLIEGVKCL